MTVANLTASIDFSLKVKQTKRKLLDIVSGAIVAYDLYPLSSNYTGPLFNARREGDNVSQDFYMTDGDFPYELFKKFLGYDTNNSSNFLAIGAVVGNPGTPPRNWVVSALAGPGLVAQIAGFGFVGGLPYVDIAVSGTLTGAGGANPVSFDPIGAIQALSGQTWTQQLYAQISVGSLPAGAAFTLAMREYNASSAFVTQAQQSVSITGTMTRLSQTATLSGGATTASVLGTLRVDTTGVTVGTVVSYTLRIALPQIRPGSATASSRAFLTTMYDQAGTGNTIQQTTAALQFAIGIGPDGMMEVQGNPSAANVMQEPTNWIAYPADMTFLSFNRSYGATWDHLYNFLSANPVNGFLSIFSAGTTTNTMQAFDNTGFDFSAAGHTASQILTMRDYAGVILDSQGKVNNYLDGAFVSQFTYTTNPRRSGNTTLNRLFVGSTSGVNFASYAWRHVVLFAAGYAAADMAKIDAILTGTYAPALNMAQAPISATITAQAMAKPTATFPVPMAARLRAATNVAPSGSFFANMTAKITGQSRAVPALSFWASLTALISGQAKAKATGSYLAPIAAAIRSGSSISGSAAATAWLNSTIRTISKLTAALRLLYPSLPSERRMIACETTGWNGAFATFYIGVSDTVTFDFAALLAKANGIDEAETIANVIDFSLSVAGPDGVDDPTPQARIAGIVNQEGSKVTQRFDGWQPNIDWIQYTVSATIMTSWSNRLVVSADLNVLRSLS
jgi:hypothetical protein